MQSTGSLPFFPGAPKQGHPTRNRCRVYCTVPMNAPLTGSKLEKRIVLLAALPPVLCQRRTGGHTIVAPRPLMTSPMGRPIRPWSP
jgi:hypothetical protein